MLMQGISLLLFAILLFFQRDKPISSIFTPLTLIAIFNGVIFILGYFISDPFDKSKTELIYGLILVLASLLIFIKASEIQNLEIGFLTGYMFINALMYAIICWNLRLELKFWWVPLIILAYTIWLIIYVFIGKPQNPFLGNALSGIQFLCCGINIVIMAFDVRRLQMEFNRPISQFTVK